MKREQIISKIYDKIRYDLLHANLLYWEEDDTNKYPLVDHLSSGNDISTGRDEIDNLIEQIEIEPLIDAILALPLNLPSDEEIVRQAHKDYPYYDIGWNDTTMKRQLWLECAKWLRDEIIKRNK